MDPWDFDRGICAQNKWNDTPYTLGPSFSSVGQVLLGVCPLRSLSEIKAILIANPRHGKNVNFVINEQLR